MRRNFSMNINGKVNNYRLTKNDSLMPLFEAIANSIFSINQRKETDSDFKGKIEIELLRENVLFDDYKDSPIAQFIVKDNGVGFTDENMDSFMTSDSRLKEKYGGKGNGRFSWLKVFNVVEVESIYKDDNKFYKRSFAFGKSTDIIEDSISEIGENELMTTIKMIGINDDFKKHIPTSILTIVTKTIEHFVVCLLSDNCPNIYLIDEENNICINDKFRNDYFGDSKKDTFVIDNYSFNITHLKIKSPEFGQNKLYYCANDRLVKSKKIDENITDLDEAIFAKEGFWYLGILTGDYLDQNVDYNRQSFSIDEDSEFDISINKMTREAVSKAKVFLAGYLEKARAEKMKRVTEYATKQAPEYRYLLNRKKDEISKLKPGLSDEELDDSLFKIKRDLEKEVKQDCDVVLQKIEDNGLDDSFEQELIETISKVSEMNKSALTNYIAKRKIIIDFFKKALRKKDNGKYELEKVVHNLIFPMKTTSESCNYENHNLWLIDEKLSYSVYVASDIALGNDPENNRPDILVCDGPVVICDDDESTFYNTISIFEIKRPQRDDYTIEDNPYTQLIKYLEKIQKGDALDKNGRPIRVGNNTQYFLYAVCDITSTLKNVIKMLGFTYFDNEKGAFLFSKNYNAYIELISFDKMLSDSELRNKVFFKKLGIE